jgi:AIG2-like family
MTWHFAYGANMSHAVMRRHALGARAVGAAALHGHRFVITADGYASVEPAPAAVVHGVLWRITPRDRVSLDAWENVPGGLYRCATLAVSYAGRRLPALIYVARRNRAGGPRPGYLDLVIAAAREWQLPEDHLAALQAYAAMVALSAGTRRIGEFG